MNTQIESKEYLFFDIYSWIEKFGVSFMQNKWKAKQLNFKQIDWKIPLLVCIVCFYLAILGNGILKGNKFVQYRGDYLAFWSVGKIANEKGFSEIYNLNYLQSVQSEGVKSLGFIENIDGPANPILPVPYFSFFVVPFQLLAKVSLLFGYWLWTFSNLIVLIGYLAFFFRKTNPVSVTRIASLYLLSIVMISYPVFVNFLNAQVEVFLVVCAGEFIRCAVGKKPLLSGIWLGGLLLKPQLLILIIPIFLIMRHWKVLLGFMVSSGTILMTSLFLSGFSGMQALINLWTKFSVGMASNFPQAMINWRMVGINLNTFTGTSIGWVFTGFGMVLTILAVYSLIKKNPTFGSPQWVMSMLGIFSATLAVNWHSHYHMAMVLIPFLIYVSLFQLSSQKFLFSWAVVTPIALFGIMIVDLFFQVVLRSNSMNYDVLIVTAFSGFILNIVVLISTFKPSHYQKLS